jgi:hypothetical protein
LHPAAQLRGCRRLLRTDAMHIEFVLNHSPRRVIGDLTRRDKRSYHCHVRNPPPEHYLPAAQILHRVIASSKKLITFLWKISELDITR